MKALMVTGSRNWTDREAVRSALVLRRGQGYTHVVLGDCRGADRIAAEEAIKLGMTVQSFAADWTKDGKAAGPLRNERMVREGGASLCLAFILGDSRGTMDCCQRALRAGIPVWPVVAKEGDR
jgi:hypothetical protein